MKQPAAQSATIRRLAIAVRGVVQGVGFRPFVYGAARSRGLVGTVRNEADTVWIEVQGESSALDAFLETLRNAHPPQAHVDSIEVSEAPCEDGQAEAFCIRPSTSRAAPRPTIPADLATCADCLAEIRNPSERRFGYPFTNCTHCGPRWSIIRRLPYDRPRTTMAGFTMCADCRAEYKDPTDRRFHAQPIACPRCGPALRLLCTKGSSAEGREKATGPKALDAVVEALRAGCIVALKGLGGFQLLADATDARAVTLLRERKRRPHRPFAIMLASLDEVRRRCEVSDAEADALECAQAPILLLRRRHDRDAQTDVVAQVAPGNPCLGVMLPCTPLHHLLSAAVDRPIICTSGNLSEEPMATGTADALERLGPIADWMLTHDRGIVRPVDDSVARVGPDGLQVLRRARGYAPLPIELGFQGPSILATGGHLKNTVALCVGSQVVLSPHIGDLDNVPSVEAHREAIRDLVDFFAARPEAVACDLHADYASTRQAEALAAEWEVPLVRVQHHHAHVASCMAEHRLEGPVLGLAWDGTGYGPDATVWGGEALVCEAAEFTRITHLRTFGLPGGDRAADEPRRSALGVLFEIFREQAARYAADWFTPSQLKTLLSMLGRSVRAPRTSSIGRLFDAVAALCGLPTDCDDRISFEGQAAMALEFAAEVAEQDAYPLALSDGVPAVADWEPLIRAVLADRAGGEPVGRISARFHNALAEMAAAVAGRSGHSQIVLTGGCFQNALLTERVRARLSALGMTVYTHRRVPPGDGGIALGQVLVAARQVKSLSRTGPRPTFETVPADCRMRTEGP